MPGGYNGKDKLNGRQQKYCIERANGKGPSEAYRAAGFKVSSARDAKDNSYRLEHELQISPKVQAEIARLKAEAEAGAILDRQARQALLTGIAVDLTEKTDNRLRATDMLNRMSGDYTDNIRSTVEGAVNLSYEEKKRLFDEKLREEKDGEI